MVIHIQELRKLSQGFKDLQSLAGECDSYIQEHLNEIKPAHLIVDWLIREMERTSVQTTDTNITKLVMIDMPLITYSSS